MSDRQRLAERIKALLSKTVERGCTEAEALAAAEKAQELLYLYQMSRSDLELEAEGMILHRIWGHDLKKRRFPLTAVAALGFGIAKFCECRGWTWAGGFEGFEFCGLRSDVEFAAWLFDALVDFGKQAYLSYELELPAGQRPDRAGFFIGFSARIRERMEDEVKRRTAGRASSGRDLIVAKAPLIQRFMDAQGIRLGRGRALATSSSAAATAGARFGDRAGFGRPVRGSSAPRLTH